MGRTAIVAGLTGEALVAVELAGRNTGVEILRYMIRKASRNGFNSTWLRTIWQQGHFSHHRVVCLIPNSMVEYRSLTLPLLPEDQLEAAATMELDGANGGAAFLYRIMARQKREQDYQIRVAAVNEQELAEYLWTFETAGLEVLWSGIRPRGIRNFIKFNNAFWNDGTESIFLDLGDQETDVGVINRENLTFLRKVPIVPWESFGEGANDFWDELRLSLASYKLITGTELPQSILLFGKNELINPISAKLAEKLNLRTVDSFKTAFTGTVTGEDIHELAPFLGLALDQLGWTSVEEQLPFYSATQSKRRNQQQQLALWGWIGLTAAIGISGILFGIQARAIKEAKIKQWLEKQTGVLGELKQTEAITVQNLKQIKLMENWLAGRGRELEFLLAFQKGIPDDTRITNLIIEDGFVKDLSGVTPSVSALLERIKTEPGLAGLSLKGTIAVTDAGEVFHLEGPLSGGQRE